MTDLSESPSATTGVRTRPVRVVFPIGMLGGGFAAEALDRAIELGADAIAIDGGSTDSGPHYLGSGIAKTSRAAVKRDLRTALIAGRAANIPLVVTTCATSGTDAGVDWVADIAEEIAREEKLAFRLATIYSELEKDTVLAALSAGKVSPLAPAGDLDAETVRSCEHIVGLMGHEPIAAALAEGADVVLTGRATDTASVAGIALGRGLPAGPSWHAAKTVECGSQCTTDPLAGGVMVEIDDEGFTIIPVTDKARATPMTVAAHMLYENADPYRLREPAGVLDTTAAVYTAVDDRVTRVEGSVFEPAAQTTIKLEGSAIGGYETISFVGIRDPHVLARMDEWLERFVVELQPRVQSLLALGPDEYQVELRAYGYNAVMGALEPGDTPPREVGVMLRVRAGEQATATAIAKIANPLMLHLPLYGETHLPSFAFATSPAEIERGAAYEFVLQHVVDVDDEFELVRTDIREVAFHG